MSDKTTPKTGLQTRDDAPLSLRAALQPSTVNDTARTVELTWTTGAAVKRRDWDGEFYEELSLDPKHVRLGRLNNGAPFLPDHSGYRVADILGVIVPGSAILAGNEGRATVRFPAEGVSADADKMYRLIKDGIVQNVSVGYRVHHFSKVEGGDAKIPTFRADDWEPFEISAVAMGADDGAGFRSLTRGEAPQMESSKMTEEEIKRAAELKAQEDAKRQADLDAKVAKATADERERIAGIEHAARACGMDAEFVAKHRNAGTVLDEVRKLALDAAAARQEAEPINSHVRFEITDDAKDKFQRGAAAWLFQKSGSDVVKRAVAAGAMPKQEFDPGEFRGLTLVDLARKSLERAGVKTEGMDKRRMVGLALTHRAGGYNSTSDFGTLMENTMHKVLLASYATTPDTWERFCARGSVSDFRAHNRYRVGSFGTLDTVVEGGEFQNKSIPDGEKASISVSTKGNIIGLTRQAIINDDLGQFLSLAARFGRSAKLSVETDVYATLAANAAMGDGIALFHASHGNLTTGAALSVAAIDLDRQAMAAQEDPSGNETLDLRPAILLVPMSLGASARIINGDAYDPSQVGQKTNAVRGLFKDVIDTGRLTGTTRYLFADPNIAPVLEVAFLDGQSEPFMEMQDEFRVDGTSWKIRLDYGVGVVDYRGAIKNVGA